MALKNINRLLKIAKTWLLDTQSQQLIWQLTADCPSDSNHKPMFHRSQLSSDRLFTACMKRIQILQQVHTTNAADVNGSVEGR